MLFSQPGIASSAFADKARCTRHHCSCRRIAELVRLTFCSSNMRACLRLTHSWVSAGSATATLSINYYRSPVRQAPSTQGAVPILTGVRCCTGAPRRESPEPLGSNSTLKASPTLEGPTAARPYSSILWLPFWRRLSYPLTGLTFAISVVDARFFQLLPACSETVAGIGFCICLVDYLWRAFFPAKCPSTDVAFENGSCLVGNSGNYVELRWTCAAMRGWRPSMEDSHIASVLPHEEGLGIVGVFDGHGGAEVSDLAPNIFVGLLMEQLEGASNQDLVSTLATAVEATDNALLAGPLGLGHALNRTWLHPFSSVGSTCCIAMLDLTGKRIIVSNTGDSRAILCREGKAVALSTDHKPEDDVEFARISKAGGRVVRSGPCYRIDNGLNLSRALGDYMYKDNSNLPMSEQKVVARPSILTHTWHDEDGDDFLIVACDGIFERMTRQAVVNHVHAGLARGQTPRQVLQGLLMTCCAFSRHELGQDNETAILVQWRRKSLG